MQHHPHRHGLASERPRCIPGHSGKREDDELRDKLLAPAPGVRRPRADPDDPNLVILGGAVAQPGQRNIGWRLDYILASPAIAERAAAAPSLADVERATTRRW